MPRNNVNAALILHKMKPVLTQVAVADLGVSPRSTDSPPPHSPDTKKYCRKKSLKQIKPILRIFRSYLLVFLRG